MNRRDILKSVALIAGPATASSVDIAVEHAPTVIVTPKSCLTLSQAEAFRESLNAEEERTGCKFVLINGDVDVKVSSGKYGYSETIGPCSISMHCQTEEEWKRWIENNVT